MTSLQIRLGSVCVVGNQVNCLFSFANQANGANAAESTQAHQSPFFANHASLGQGRDL